MLRAAVLGATGAVGQTFVRLLTRHPLFEIVSLVASERSAGKPYREAARWLQSEPLDGRIGDLVVEGVDAAPEADVVFSGLDASVAGDVEADWARRGYAVVSNARNYRMDPTVPLLVPEVNPDHLALVDRQDWGSGGFIVTNPNCSTVGLVMALAPLHQAYGVQAVHVVTMQALSGAGYPGVASLDALGNVVPFIGGEEEKMATETKKLLGTLTEAGVEGADVTVSAQCNRVPVMDGHLEAVSVRLGGSPSAADVAETLRSWTSPLAGRGLPTAPEAPLLVTDDPTAPQPRTHVHLGGGMTVTVGRIQDCPVLGVKFVVLSHNTVRGAAGGAILNAELLHAEGRIGAGARAQAA
ncbi:aspartate-semialdehyde dehydrogenase [Rubrivirga marina]|uniref:Aspartate-semialdehyde dehydrogenase n=1 Tax=Rubrivirga marina TaxID=1196024 RepID=A0A271J2V1_9BACT|nr:aspartate-semialdehyde dehydrogenase [Rubrivirga marina]PAP77039.1 aspartate-semialdehyde dehydrogenase [Rubrivirga marina]